MKEVQVWMEQLHSPSGERTISLWRLSSAKPSSKEILSKEDAPQYPPVPFFREAGYRVMVPLYGNPRECQISMGKFPDLE